MPDWIKPLLENLGRFLVAFFSFLAGKQTKELEQTKAVLDDVKKASDVANTVATADANTIKRLRDKWTKK